MQQTEPIRGKIRLDLGDIRFSGEGNQDWLEEQLDKFIDAVNSGKIRAPSTPSSMSQDTLERSETSSVGTLATYLKDKNADTVQNHRFLATAAWLKHRGERSLTTGSVAKALRENQQKRLGNPSDCLRQNIARGFCEKDGNGFFITPEGWQHLHEEQQ